MRRHLLTPLVLLTALALSACAGGDPGGNQPPATVDPGASTAPTETAPTETEPTELTPVTPPGTKNTAFVQVGDWSHSFPIEGRLNHPCIVQSGGDVTVRDERNSAESFALELVGTDDIYIAFFSESALRGYVAGEPFAAEDLIESFEITTPIPPLSADMFEIEDARLSGSISMLDIFNDQIMTATINVTC